MPIRINEQMPVVKRLEEEQIFANLPKGALVENEVIAKAGAE